MGPVTDGFSLVGSAASGEATLAAVDELHPDLVLMDVHLPGISGVESTRPVRARCSVVHSVSLFRP
jgi:DNA-binding NarL/FixJ family response regulator